MISQIRDVLALSTYPYHNAFSVKQAHAIRFVSILKITTTTYLLQHELDEIVSAEHLLLLGTIF